MTKSMWTFLWKMNHIYSTFNHPTSVKVQVLVLQLLLLENMITLYNMMHWYTLLPNSSH